LQSESLLEQALVLLWELVQHQWALFEDKEASLVDALFRLRACSNQTVCLLGRVYVWLIGQILESTYSLLSLLTSATDHLILLGVIQSSFETFDKDHPADPSSTTETPDSTQSALVSPEHIVRSSGYIFALNGIGMCILRLPQAVVLTESPRLEPLVMTAMTSPILPIRQAANTLILAVQCVLQDSSATLALFPRMTQTQRNLSTYLMETNGLIPHKAFTSQTGGSNGKVGHEATRDIEEGRKEKVLGEMDALMSKSGFCFDAVM
jgi:CLIP-associating protein 1/2